MKVLLCSLLAMALAGCSAFNAVNEVYGSFQQIGKLADVLEKEVGSRPEINMNTENGVTTMMVAFDGDKVAQMRVFQLADKVDAAVARSVTAPPTHLYVSARLR